MISEFKSSLRPWIILNEGGYDIELIQQFHRVRQALDNLLAMKITWHEYLDILEAEGVDMDDYLQTAEDNLISVGF